jgi:glycosyltransferase involved in cell wall biosynthesis
MNCYNGARHLDAALESVLAQTFRDWEIVFWDNASTDATPDIVQRAAAKDDRIRVFRAQTTTPLGAARNLALHQCRGEFIAFLDCDDLWRPEKLERQMACFAANPRVGLVCTDTTIGDGKRTIGRVFSRTAPVRGMAFVQLMERQWITMSSAVLARKALGWTLDGDGLPDPDGGGLWFDETLQVCEEADLFYRVAHDWELDFVDEPLTLWRVHGANTTIRRFGQFALETEHILEKHRRLYPGYDAQYPELVELLTRRAAFQRAVSLWREGKGREARDVIAPWRNDCRKHRVFWWASHLPGGLFDLGVKIYFALPMLRR